MAETMSPKVLIAGGGIGGLTAAIALRRAGIETRVFERSTSRQDVQQYGGGIVLWHNAMRALQKIGLDEQIQAVAPRLRRAENRSWRGGGMGALPVEQLGRLMGVPAVSISRLNLYQVLAGPLDDETVQLGREVTDFVQDEAGVTVRFADGREERGDLLIVADGRRSRLRLQFGNVTEDYPPYAGYTHWSGVAEIEHELAKPGLFPLFWGCGMQFYYFHLGERQVYWAGTEFVPEGGRDPEGGSKAAALERFGTWPAPIAALIEATPDATVHRRDISGGVPADTWGAGRVTLLGDAAHPLTITLGQGAAMAIEDAIALAEQLSTAQGDYPAALRAYERERMARSARVMKLQIGYEKSAAERNPVGCRIRNFFVGLAFSPLFIKRTGYYKEMSIVI